MDALQLGAAARDILDRLDIPAMRRLWSATNGHLEPLKSDFEVLATMHVARTQAAAIELAKRAYSHQWLQANGLPSLLPNELKPAAERYDYRFAFGVGIGMIVQDPDSEAAAVAPLLQKAMGDAAAEAVLDGRHLDTPFLRQRMDEARDRTLRRLGRPKVTVKVDHDFAALRR